VNSSLCTCPFIVCLSACPSVASLCVCLSVCLIIFLFLGAGFISQALKEHTNERLVELDLGYNEIKDEGACAVAQVWIPTSGHFEHLIVHSPDSILLSLLLSSL